MVLGLLAAISMAAPRPPVQCCLEPQVAALSQEDKRHQRDIADDVELGKKYAEEVLKELKLSKDADGQSRIDRIAGELARIANSGAVKCLWGDARLNPFEYSFKLVEGKDVNAFSLPGGFIFVYEGLLKYCESDDELAGVMAHEIAHASLRHLATLRREQSRLQSITLPLILISILTGGSAGPALAETGALASQAIGSGWSVKAEESADFAGFQYMAKSSFNPVGILTFMERLAYDDRSRPNIDWGIYRTHPPSRLRAEEMKSRLREFRIPIERSKVSATLRTKVEAGKDSATISFAGQKIFQFGGPRAFERAMIAAKNIDSLMDQVPKLFEISIGKDGSTLLGKGRELFVVEPEDAALNGIEPRAAVNAAQSALKSSVYNLAYRVWDAY